MINSEKLKKSIFNKMVLFSVIPIFVLFIVAMVALVFQASRIQKENIKSYTKSMEHNIETVDNSFENILNSIEFLCFNESVFNALTINQDYERVSDTYNLRNILTEYKNSNDLIESVGIYFREQGYVVTNRGRSSVDEYIEKNALHCNYDIRSYMDEDIPILGYRVLGPLRSSQRADGYVIPVIVGMAKNVQTSNLILVNIKCDNLAKYISNDMIDGINCIIVEKNTQTEYFSNMMVSMDEKQSEDVIKCVSDGNNCEGVYEGRKYIILSGKSTKLDNFSYGIMVPKKVIEYDFFISLLITGLFMIFFFIIDIFICYYFTQRIYAPIRQMANFVKNSKNELIHAEGNELSIISEYIKHSNENNKEMRKKISSYLSIINENYLYKFLNSAYLQNEDEMRVCFLNNNDFLEFDDYVAVIVRMQPTEAFCNHFTKDEYSTIMYGVNSILTGLTNRDISNKNIVLSPDEQHFIVIINVESAETKSAVSEKFQEFVNYFTMDAEYVRIFVGIGEKHNGFLGMKQSYSEAKSALSSIIMRKDNAVMVYSADKIQSMYYSYTIEDENMLYNYIINGQYESVEKKVYEIVERNIGKNLDSEGWRRLYAQIRDVALMVIQTKKLSVSELMRDERLEIIDEKTVDGEQFIDYVNTLLRKTTEYVFVKNTKVDIEDVKKYIDEHFAEELYLDNVSAVFNVNAKYFSRLVKQQIGMNFNTYVIMVKVAKVKDMLKKTPMSINEIMEKTGFNSRNTFLRAFKKFEGVTPSEFRKLYRDKINNNREENYDE